MRVPVRLIVAMTLVVSAVVAFSGSAASAPTWSIRPSENVAAARNSTLDAVSCAGVTCFGVGQTTFGSRGTALIERPGPSGWTVVPTPTPEGARFSALLGISCPAVKVCFAVGNADSKTLIERWNGTKWSIIPSPNKGRWVSRLSAISCVNIRNCFAVGQYQAALIATLTERWNGSKWTIVPSPSRKPSPMFTTSGINDLLGVSCTSGVNCFAVGYDRGYEYTFSETLIERWNGKKWSAVPSPKGPYVFDQLTGVSCTSINNCYAVGDSFAKGGVSTTLIVHWDGKKWASVPSADPVGVGGSVLQGISCGSKTSCVAVGYSIDSTTNNSTTLVKTLSGGTWSIVPSPNPEGATHVFLNGVSCLNATICNAVGDSYGDSFVPVTLVEHAA